MFLLSSKRRTETKRKEMIHDHRFFERQEKSVHAIALQRQSICNESVLLKSLLVSFESHLKWIRVRRRRDTKNRYK